jgi:hypothetical protein
MNWNEEMNSRRRNLIDKEIGGTLNDQERQELSELQDQAMAYRESVSPLPMSQEAMECLSRLSPPND